MTSWLVYAAIGLAGLAAFVAGWQWLLLAIGPRRVRLALLVYLDAGPARLLGAIEAAGGLHTGGHENGRHGPPLRHRGGRR